VTGKTSTILHLGTPKRNVVGESDNEEQSWMGSSGSTRPEESLSEKETSITSLKESEGKRGIRHSLARPANGSTVRESPRSRAREEKNLAGQEKSSDLCPQTIRNVKGDVAGKPRETPRYITRKSWGKRKDTPRKTVKIGGSHG